jgi:UDP-glucuronate 4-epimerase
MTVLVTGAAGFIGFHVSQRLLAQGERVIGLDCVNDYYDPRLKERRLEELHRLDSGRFTFRRCDFADTAALAKTLENETFDRVVHLGAQAGVRYSIEQPMAYVTANLVGHVNMLELARHRGVRHMVYASSSSVYGSNVKLPFSESDRVDHPISLYAATKKADELISETYSHLYGIPLTGLRFFTVYGPWGRPDMAMWIFTRKILAGQPIEVFNNGKMRRDFTYIDDIVSGIVGCLATPPVADGREKAGGSFSAHRVYNIGNHRSEELMDMIGLIERACGREAIVDFQPLQPGDVPETYADIEAIQRDIGYAPTTRIDVGVPRFVEWYMDYHQVTR